MGDYIVLTVHQAWDGKDPAMKPDGHLQRVESLTANNINIGPLGIDPDNRTAFSDARRKYDSFLGDPEIVDTIVDQILAFIESGESATKDLARFGMTGEKRGLFKAPPNVRDRSTKKQYKFTAALKNAIEIVAQELDVPLVTPVGVYNEHRYILVLADDDGSVV